MFSYGTTVKALLFFQKFSKKGLSGAAWRNAKVDYMNQNDPVPDDFTLSPALVDALPALFFLPATWYWWQEFCFYHEYAVSRKPLIYRRLPAHLLWTFYVDAIRVLDRNKKFHVMRLGISW